MPGNGSRFVHVGFRIVFAAAGAALLAAYALQGEWLTREMLVGAFSSLAAAPEAEVIAGQRTLTALFAAAGLVCFALAAAGLPRVKAVFVWWVEAPRTQVLIAALVVAVAVRALAMLLLPDVGWNRDSDAYHQLAVNLLERGVYAYRNDFEIWYMPLWPVLLTIPYAAFGKSLAVAAAFGGLFQTAVPFLVYGLARSIWSEKEGRVALLIALVQPSYALYHLMGMQEVVFLPLVIGMAWLTVLMARGFTWGRLLGLAALVFLGCYERQSGIVYLVLPPLALLLCWSGFPDLIKRCAVYVAVGIVALGPWCYTASKVAGQFVLMTADATHVVARGITTVERDNEEEHQRLLDELRKGGGPAVFTEFVSDYLRNNAGAYVKKVAVTAATLLTHDHLPTWQFGEEKAVNGAVWKRLARRSEQMVALLWFGGMLLWLALAALRREPFGKAQIAPLLVYGLMVGAACVMLAFWTKYIYPVSFVPIVFSARLLSRLGDRNASDPVGATTAGGRPMVRHEGA